MLTIPLIVTYLNNAASVTILLMTTQRWDSIRRQFNNNFMNERWFIVTMVVAIIVLSISLVAVSLYRKQKERKTTHKLFTEYADKRGLTESERKILLGIANRAGVKQSDAIFTMSSAFDRGTAKLLEGTLIANESKRLKTELPSLREKLGFQKPLSSSVSSSTKSKELSSRQIPVGKKIYITRRKTRTADNLEATVIRNDNMELALELDTPLESMTGDFWCARYYFGASVWEFDTSTIRSNGNILVLNHSDNIRFVNRRRFARAPVNRPAFIARFPFETTSTADTDNSKAASDIAKRAWAPPVFIPATLTELAGSGLRLESALEIKTGERVLVMFRLDEEEDSNSATIRNRKSTTSRIIEDIGLVRHTKAIDNGLSVAVELTGMNDADLGELIRITNKALIKAKGQDIPETEKQDTPEPVAIQQE